MKTGNTVAWLAPIMYEAMLRARVAMTEFRRGETITTLPWDQTSEEERAIFRGALRDTLAALDDPALLKLHEHEPVFVLRGQDLVAPPAIMEWRKLAISKGMPFGGDKAERCSIKITDFLRWQREHAELIKIPD